MPASSEPFSRSSLTSGSQPRPTTEGNAALRVATRVGRIRSAELLLGCGSIVHMANDAGNTTLHEAVKNGYSKLTRLLQSRGSRAVYPENKESKSPPYLAMEIGNLEILKLLKEAIDENEIPWSKMQTHRFYC
ncbi:hypothetical protein ACJRO7_010059 [Eucalyptus globulus]|uniref:Uncharacterized protein n=1 Tax=Eucalyptus globulus TaxID=34317 RepID=A0ABD3LGE3_EUCGL